MLIESVLDIGRIFNRDTLSVVGGSGVAKSLNYFGPLLGIAVYVLICLNIYVYFMTLLPIIYLFYGNLVSWIATMYGLYLVICITVNHFLGMIVKPGWLKDYYFLNESKEEKEMRHTDNQRHRLIMPNSSDMAMLMKYSHWDLDSIKHYNEKQCERWEWLNIDEHTDTEIAEKEEYPIKPLRFHHCSICGDWIMNMDHHCPWFNNCVGIYNWRFFLLFLLHLWLSSVFMLYFLYEWNGHPFFYRNGGSPGLTMGLHIGLFFGIGFFWGWQWYLWLKGKISYT